MKQIKSWRGLFLISTLMGLSSLTTYAQNFPTKPIQVVVPVAAGGGTDLLARNLSQKVSEVLGQPLVVENKLGAGGNIGVEYVMKSKADGYTLLISPATIATNVAVYKKIPYDLVKDLQAITLKFQDAKGGNFQVEVQLNAAIPSVAQPSSGAQHHHH